MKPARDFTFNSALLFLYCLLLAFAMHFHELWGDEIHSWNIAKGSHSLAELFRNIRYEGHPPFWYLLLYGVTTYTHSVFFLKALQFAFAVATASVFIYMSPFSRMEKILVLCGYYFIFEYAVLARNYMPGVFFAFCIASIFNREFKGKVYGYYILLFLLSNVHLLALVLAISIHAGYCIREKRLNNSFGKNIMAGVLIFLPSLYFILPPGDSQLNASFWIGQWTVSKVYLFITVIVKSLLPFPDVEKFHWWNTHLLLDNDSLVFRLISFCVFIFLAAALYFVSWKSKPAFRILFINLLLTFLLSLIFPLNTSRYVGFILVGFICSAWISNSGREIPFNRNIFLLLLALQVPAGVFALVKDHEKAFSAGEKVVEMQKLIPSGAFAATDYWCLNNLSAFLDTSYYCVELKRSVSFLVWNSEMRTVIHYDYAKGLEEVLKTNQQKSFYFFSSHSADEILKDSSSPVDFKLNLISSQEESIEKSGRVFLYLVGTK